MLAATGNTLSFNVGAFQAWSTSILMWFNQLCWSDTLNHDAAYNEQNGVVLVTTATPSGAVAGDIVTMQGLVFTCNSGGLDNAAGKVIFQD